MNTHTCGDCMHLLPNVDIDEHNPPLIERGEGKGQPAYWVCMCKEARRNYKQGRFDTDGKRCSHFDDKYANPRRIDDWLAACRELTEGKRLALEAEIISRQESKRRYRTVRR